VTDIPIHPLLFTYLLFPTIISRCICTSFSYIILQLSEYFVPFSFNYLNILSHFPIFSFFTTELYAVVLLSIPSSQFLILNPIKRRVQEAWRPKENQSNQAGLGVRKLSLFYLYYEKTLSNKKLAYHQLNYWVPYVP
jgi:hypothetical protein